MFSIILRYGSLNTRVKVSKFDHNGMVGLLSVRIRVLLTISIA